MPPRLGPQISFRTRQRKVFASPLTTHLETPTSSRVPSINPTQRLTVVSRSGLLNTQAHKLRLIALLRRTEYNLFVPCRDSIISFAMKKECRLSFSGHFAPRRCRIVFKSVSTPYSTDMLTKSTRSVVIDTRLHINVRTRSRCVQSADIPVTYDTVALLMRRTIATMSAADSPRRWLKSWSVQISRPERRNETDAGPTLPSPIGSKTRPSTPFSTMLSIIFGGSRTLFSQLRRAGLVYREAEPTNTILIRMGPFLSA
ncbi:hypothetical protein BDP81DRAFT_144875 [Colletotrichum phormii]|uniref:Uncharacterized protein n=1 Tax=Colletotrichum phormii TaxID=359342 RepID=A0AAI9ZE90_9PEZI|nr:uncharacterized protein BDP81DRAFT_144875 [Colletotrichum phormii]KAK1622618.1 hypothetical protein BDP81DRAFT_144875 [Colletotrichum phormii]